MLIGGCDQGDRSARSPTATTASKVYEVRLIIDFNGRKENLELTAKASEGDQVFDVICRELEVDSTGQGRNVFVRAINGVENEGGGGDNWIFFVDDVLSNRGCGDYVIKPGQQIRWRFGKYEPNGSTE